MASTITLPRSSWAKVLEGNGLEEQAHAGCHVHDLRRRIIMENVVEEKGGGGCVGSCGK